MKSLLLLFGVLIIFTAFFERQAGYCGAGWWHPDLPYGVQPDWFNGAFVLNDAEGWGAINSLTTLQTNTTQLINIKRVLRYAFNERIYVEIMSTEDKVYYVIIDDPGFQGRQLIAYNNLEFERYSKNHNKGSLSWISVDSRSCYFGVFNVVRIAVGLAIVLLGSLLFLRQRRHT